MIYEDLKEKYPIFVETVNYLEENCYFFKSTLQKIKEIGLDYELAEKLCRDCLNHVSGEKKKYFERVHTLIDFSVEFLRLQLHLHKTGKYLYSSYEQLDKYVYSDPNRKLKGPWYTWALYFSQIFWVTHWNVLKFFLTDFVGKKGEQGDVLEVPTGTGIFIALFLAKKPGWKGVGVDLGETSIEFTKNTLSWNNITYDRMKLIKEDIYKWETDKKFDSIICGEFLEHVEDPLGVLKKLKILLKPDGWIFLTVAVYASMIDHIYLYHSADEVREHIKQAGLEPEKELVQAVFEKKNPEEKNTPVNYCAILKHAPNKILERFLKIISLFNDKDKEDMKKFLAEYFHPNYILIDDKFFDWQYVKNPFNFYPKYSMKIIKRDGKFLGYLGLVPYRFKLFDKSYEKCGALCNLMINNSCRTMGLGCVLVYVCQKDFLLMTGTSYDPKTEGMYKRIGNWFPMGNLSRYILVLNPEKCAMIENPSNPNFKKFDLIIKASETKNKVPLVSEHYEIEEIRRFDDSISDFWKRVKHRYPIAVEREDEYLNWRFTNHPKLKYQIFVAKKNDHISGYIVSRTEKAKEGKNKFLIGRMLDFVAEEECEAFLLDHYVKKMKEERMDIIDFFFTGVVQIPSLESLGFLDADRYNLIDIPLVFRPIERNRKHINFLIYIDDSLMHLAEKIKDINNWYITRVEGDQDRPSIPKKGTHNETI